MRDSLTDLLQRMNFTRLRLLLLGLAIATLMPACVSVTPKASDRVVAYKPRNPDAVRVKVSLNTQNIYVMEGNDVLMAVQGCVGTVQKPTPKGNFRVYLKLEKKRSNSYGFRVSGNNITGAKSSDPVPGRYVGYPMGYWCEFAPAYGFHHGFVHPAPRTHGCIRLTKEAAPRFFALVKLGTPVSIADSQPEDATIGKSVARVDESRLPDPSAELMISDAAFFKPAGPLLLDR
jgi:hypothetical protein